MNKRLSYEEEMANQLENLPLPDENMAWADMKRRLKEEDDDRFIPFWLNGCFLWTLVGVVIFALGWWIIRSEKWFEKKDGVPDKTIAISQPKEKEQNDLSQNKIAKSDSSVFFKTTTPGQQNESAQDHKKEEANRVGRKKSSIAPAVKENTAKQNGTRMKTKSVRQFDSNDNVSRNRNSIVKANQEDSFALLQHQIPGADIVNTIVDQCIDTTKKSKEKIKNDSLQRNELAKDSKSDSSKSSKFSLAAGFSLHQQLPVNGQKFVPYNSEGRKGTFADYIPSVYLRMYRGNSWFIQSEFRYGAPQYTKEFLYQQKTDSVLNGTITASTSLKKTYYHQLPLTFNYFVSKKLSVGGGLVWNRFVSAISSQDIVQHNRLNGTDSIISKGMIIRSEITDSGNVFVKSWFQALFEAEYKWNRFSVGARYAIGLEPYINFELPGHPAQQEKNSSLDIFIRYELWRSKKK